MVSVIDVSNIILEISREDSPDGEFELISHMKLQKLVYFCQGFHLALYGCPLFPETIEAWPHGPVCPRLYHILKIYGPSPITAMVDPDKINVNTRERHIINMVYDTYGQYSASKLRMITHKEGPWSNTAGGSVIPQDVIKEHFKAMIESGPATNSLLPESEKMELEKILEEAEKNGEINLSQFCVGMGA
jgi:uncharacterized phage-associated protein